ncbi:MAG: thiamine phosphate synthase [Planctomycetota bacterium]|nr:thiamine phosphate synthase [Planctomycetota bacterium]
MSESQATRRLPPKLLALSPGDLQPEGFAAWLKDLGRCVDAGLLGVLIREPHLPDALRLYLALQVAKRLKPNGGFVAMHDSAHLARAAGVDALHLGFRSLPLEEVRAWCHDSLSLGLSTHQGDLYGSTRPDYAFYGPVFETPSKVGLKAPVGLEDLAKRCSDSPVPIWGLGGIHPETAAAVLDSGVAGLAVRGAIWQSKRPWREVQEFHKHMGGSLD